jgi:cyclopropane fatty-acyl-phospholipid synthase-like methyltransferase
MKEIDNNPKFYDDQYYERMRGSDHYSDDNEVYPLFDKALNLVKDKIVDGTIIEFGCGRGELLRASLKAGARKVIGVDFSKTSIDLSQKYLEKHCQKESDRWELHCIDAAKFKTDESVQVVFMLDFVEHVPQDILDKVFSSCSHFLDQNGCIIIHTFPTRLPSRMYQYLVRKGLIDNKEDIEIHINTQSRHSINEAVSKANLCLKKIWFEAGYLSDSNVTIGLITKYPLLKPRIGAFVKFLNIGITRKIIRAIGCEQLFYMSLWAIITKP